METFSALLALCAGNSPVSGEFPSKRSETQRFDVFFDRRLNKRSSKQSWGWWFETPSRPLWRHCNETPHNRLACESDVWGACFEYKFWFMLYLSHYSAACHIMLYWTALSRYPAIYGICWRWTHWLMLYLIVILREVIFKLFCVISGWGSSCEIALRWSHITLSMLSYLWYRQWWRFRISLNVLPDDG